MERLFESSGIEAIARPRPVRAAVWSILAHAVAIAALLYLGLPGDEPPRLPEAVQLVQLSAPPPAPPPPPPAATARPVRVPRTTRTFETRLTAPARVPSVTPLIIEAPPDIQVEGGVSGGVEGGVVGGIPGGVLGGLVGSAPGIEPPAPAPAPRAQAPPLPPPPPPAPPKRIEVAASVQEAMLLEMTPPLYPPAAKMARVQGTVRLRAVVDRQGRITELKVVSGHALLVPAAVEAVKKWRYRPTYLNGEAVEVAAEIVVNFLLQ